MDLQQPKIKTPKPKHPYPWTIENHRMADTKCSIVDANKKCVAFRVDRETAETIVHAVYEYGKQFVGAIS